MRNYNRMDNEGLRYEIPQELLFEFDQKHELLYELSEWYTDEWFEKLNEFKTQFYKYLARW